MEIKANKYAGKDILRFICENTNLTQKEFADELGLSRMAVAKWETNISEPSPATIKKLIEFCQKNKIRITR